MSIRLTASAAVLTAALAVTCAMAQDKSRGSQDKAKGHQQTPAEAAQKFLKQHDKNADGSLSRDELPAGLREEFGDMDANKDGKLSADELQTFASRLVFVPVPVEVVSWYVVEAASDPPSRDDLQRAYDMLRKADANHDGTLSADELRAAREHAIQGRVDAIFKRCDTNHDGKIEKGECPDDLTGLFNRTDKNHDGAITKDELKACCTKAADRSGEHARSGGKPGK
jgi:Ca2+-binding EF-hand superfamily protein